MYMYMSNSTLVHGLTSFSVESMFFSATFSCVFFPANTYVTGTVDAKE